MVNFKLFKSLTATILGASILTTAVVVPGGDSSAKVIYKLTSKGILVNSKTSKVVNGYKYYKGKLYKDGKKLTGFYKKKYYLNGVKATGTYKSAYYYKGVKKVTTGLYNGYYYKNGVKATGTYKGAYYVKGIKKVTTGLYKGKFYKEGTLNVGLAMFKGKYYFNATLANGLITDANGNAKSYKKGLVVTYTVNPVATVYVLGDYTLASTVKDSKYTSDEPIVVASTKAGKTTLNKAKGEYTVTASPILNTAFFKEKDGKYLTQKTVNRIVTITETGEKISVPVTYSIDPAKATKVEVFKSGTKEPISKVKIANKVTKVYSLADLLKAVDFKITDQYGVQSVPLIDADSVSFTTISGNAQFTNNSSKLATINSATVGSRVNATVTKDGKSVTVEITFENAFDFSFSNGGTEGDIKVVLPKEFNGTSEKPKVFEGNIKVDITDVSKLENAVINGDLVLTGTASRITFTKIKVKGNLDVSGIKGSEISFDGIEVEEAAI